MRRGGMLEGHAALESRIRRLVADQLGLGAEELVSHVSLTDDLAADSLDMVELTLTLEEQLDVAISEYALKQVRTYGDLVDTILGSIKRGRAEGLHKKSILVRARVLGADERGDPGVVRTVELTPYAAEGLGEAARRAGRGARLELVVPQASTDVEVAWVAAQFAWLDARGISVSVHRDAQSTQSSPSNALGS